MAQEDTAVALVGCGVVGRAILIELLKAGCEVLLCDLQPAALQSAIDQAVAATGNLQQQAATSPWPDLQACRLSKQPLCDRPLGWMIESISENLTLKQTLFSTARAALGDDCILASNTSNLSIESIFAPLSNDSRTLGMHFFMPVAERPLVELIPRRATDAATVARSEAFVQRLGKQPLTVADSPGFVVNRLLAPYLNQALLLLGLGATDRQLADTAHEFGMPMSPLELIDRIGMRTAFDSGRVFWQHFPGRIDPAPILPGMIKAKRLGRDFGGGFYDYDESGHRNKTLHPQAAAVVDKYRRDSIDWTPTRLLPVLAIPMWIEAATLLASGVVSAPQTIEQAVTGGLGYCHPGGFWQFFDQLGPARILDVSRSPVGQPALTLPDWLAARLQRQVN